MNTVKQKKVLFLHGLESKPVGEKIDWLSKKCNLLAPEIDYRSENIFQKVLDIANNFDPDIVVGSSMGGYFGYYIAATLQTKALLLNPALAKESSLKPSVNDLGVPPGNLCIILGINDNVVNPKETKDWVANKGIGKLTIREVKFGHRIPYHVFVNEVSRILG